MQHSTALLLLTPFGRYTYLFRATRSSCSAVARLAAQAPNCMHPSQLSTQWVPSSRRAVAACAGRQLAWRLAGRRCRQGWPGGGMLWGAWPGSWLSRQRGCAAAANMFGGVQVRLVICPNRRAGPHVVGRAVIWGLGHVQDVHLSGLRSHVLAARKQCCSGCLHLQCHQALCASILRCTAAKHFQIS